MTFETHDLVVRYRRELPPALDGVTLSIPKGGVYAVLGPNGSGKSTLMRALLGSIRPTEGRVTLDGRDIADWNRRALARKVGGVAQREEIAFPIRVRDLVGMGRYPHLGPFEREGRRDEEAIGRALSACDALHLSGREVGTLSGGELQRVRIARALAQEPEALLLDEPTAGLDLRHEMEILGLMRSSAAAGMTVVLITHDLDAAARFADRILLLDRGQVAAEGGVEEVLREEVLEAVYEWRLAVRVDPLTGRRRITPLD